jgi:hypothetical protein
VARISVSYDDDFLRRNVESFPDDLDRKIQAVMDFNAAYGETYIKTNARWTDRTGAARSGLTALASSSGSTYEILMAYSVTYGIWLEIANDRKYAIITPAMRIVGEKVMRDLQGLLDNL